MRAKFITRLRVVWCVGVIGLFALGEVRAEAGYRIIEDTLEGSLIKISVPTNWNKNVLILAHGLRSPELPLSADFTADKGYSKTLSDEGWLIASTSYRRNGYIIEEAIEDVEALRRYVIKRFGTPQAVYLNGASMGGAIVTLMAETHSAHYAGALVIGPALGMNRNTYRFQPAMPLVMLTNQNERAEPDIYRQKVGTRPLVPARWIVKRDGHCNVTNAETLAALRAVVRWSEGGAIELEKDGTVVPPVPASTAVFSEDGARAKIVRRAPSRGSFDTEFTAADLEKLGIRKGESFAVGVHDKSVNVYYGTGYFDVPKGEWIAFIVAEGGRLRVGRNAADAVTVLACEVGDTLAISRP